MRKSRLGYAVLFIFIVVFAGYGDTTSLTSIRKEKFSLGVNNLPWDATQIAFRRWCNNTKGNQFTIGYNYISIGDQYENNKSIRISLSELSYDWLTRRKAPLLDDLYITRGFGLNFPFTIYWEKRSYNVGYEEHLDLYIPFPFKVCFGIEHFFIKKYPISYSIQADSRASFNYHYICRTNNGDPQKQGFGTFTFNIRPQFFLWFYLR